MRDIIFRGIPLDWNEFIYGSCVVYDDRHYIYTKMYEKATHLGILSQVLVSPETVGEYTGLKDKNGVKIFDGDIVRFYPKTHKQDVLNGMHPERWDFKVLYEMSCFGYIGNNEKLHHIDDLVFKPFYDQDNSEIYHTDSNIEVIGNIHETKE